MRRFVELAPWPPTDNEVDLRTPPNLRPRARRLRDHAARLHLAREGAVETTEGALGACDRVMRVRERHPPQTRNCRLSGLLRSRPKDCVPVVALRVQPNRTDDVSGSIHSRGATVVGAECPRSIIFPRVQRKACQRREALAPAVSRAVIASPTSAMAVRRSPLADLCRRGISRPPCVRRAGAAVRRLRRLGNDELRFITS